MPRGRPVTRHCFAQARVGTTGSSHRRARAAPTVGPLSYRCPTGAAGPRPAGTGSPYRSMTGRYRGADPEAVHRDGGPPGVERGRGTAGFLTQGS